MKIRGKYLILPAIFLISFTGCKKGTVSRERQGEIIYDIEYLHNGLKNFNTDMLPKKLTVRFKDNNTAMEINGFFGLFNICNVVNTDKKTNITYLNVLDKKFYYEGDYNEPAVGFGSIPRLKIRQGKQTKEICGYIAKEAFVLLPDNNVPIPVYYTSDIPIKNPNRATPYRDINGVLLEFYLNVSSLKMKLTATGIYFKNIDDNYFARRKGYVKVSRKQLEEILNKLME
jgi:GLPGLI family protein